MKSTRRQFIAAGSTAALVGLSNHTAVSETSGAVANALEKPVLKTKWFPQPVEIASMELLHRGGEYLVRVRSKDGAEGIAVSHPGRMNFLYPIFLQKVVPYFIGKDARDLDALIDGVFVYQSNYKLQGVPFWICVASAEFAILDMLGRIANQPVGELIGEVHQRDISMYRASGNRGNTAEEEAAILKRLVEETGAKAVKFKLGGRMSKNVETPQGRSERLIPLARKTLGDDMIIYVDSNGSYDVPKSIEIGRLCEANKMAFFEEPCPFDHLWETKEIADALDIPIAGGEQESSLRRFRWMIENNAVQIVQPDLFYFGGFTRCIRVANMAAAAGMKIVPHMSGGTLGYFYVLHFASSVANVGQYMEYKGKDDRVPYECKTSDLECKNGTVRVPSGPGFGIDIDPDYIKGCQVLT